jgi:hypothetical protein
MLKGKIIALIVIGMAFSCLSAQNEPSITWTKTYGGSGIDRGYSIQQTQDTGYIITGWTNSFGDTIYGDVYLIKIDSTGNPQWQKNFGGIGEDRGFCCQQTKDLGYIIIGKSKSLATPYNAMDDVYLIKTDSLGNLEWQKTFGDSNAEWGTWGQQTNDGGYIITGGIAFPNQPPLTDVYFIKTDSLGNLEWQKTYGGNYNDGGLCCQQTQDKGYIITGITQSFGDSIYSDVYLIKTDSLGNLKWQRTYGGSRKDWAFSVKQTNDKGYIITGYTYSFGDTLYSDVYLIKTDSLGNLSWQKNLGGNRSDRGLCVQQTTDTGYIIAGWTTITGELGDRDNVYILKTDSRGNLEWKHHYGTSFDDRGFSVQQTFDGSYIITGAIEVNNSDVYVLKLHYE